MPTTKDIFHWNIGEKKN